MSTRTSHPLTSSDSSWIVTVQVVVDKEDVHPLVEQAMYSVLVKNMDNRVWAYVDLIREVKNEFLLGYSSSHDGKSRILVLHHIVGLIQYFGGEGLIENTSASRDTITVLSHSDKRLRITDEFYARLLI